MGLINTLRVQVDKPVWEWTRFAPATSSALSASCSPDNSKFNPNNGRYIYYLISGSSFWRYDTWTDAYIQLASPATAPVSFSTMRFAGAQGFRNRVISATTNTITTGAFSGEPLVGFDIRITGGTGMGQRRVVTGVSAPVSLDSGVVTAATTSVLTDTTKSWAINQWVGHMVRIVYGGGLNVSRKIIANTATTITVLDTSQYGYEPDCNPQQMTGVSASAGVQSHYSIESSTITVDTPWDITPDATTRFTILSGAIFLISSATSAPFYTFQQYDIASDTWYIRNATGGMLSAVGTDCRLERFSENSSLWERGRASSGTATTLVDTSKSWATNRWIGYTVRIFSGTARGRVETILSNSSNTLTFASGATPDATSYYVIEGFDAGVVASGTTTTINTTKTWSVDRWKNYDVVITEGTGAGQSRSILSNTTSQLAVSKPFAVAPDATSKFSIRGDADKMWVIFGGQSQMFHQDNETDLMTTGRQIDNGVVRLASAQFADHPAIAVSSGSGSSGTITITTAVPHNFKSGMSITHRGDTGASNAANNITATITVTGTSTYTYAAPGSTAAWTIPAISATTIVDASKTWTTNQWAGHLVTFTTGQGPTATAVTMQIASNTATTLTLVGTATSSANGISRYAITARQSLGAVDHGIATGTQSTTTLQDTSKSWAVNQWAGKRVRFTGGTGQNQEYTVTSNTSNTLSFAAGTSPVSGSTTYSLLGNVTRGLGPSLEWGSGTSDPEKRGRYIYSARGGGLVGFDRYDIVTDTWLPLNTSPQTETLTTGSMYAYDGGDRLYFTKEVTQRVYYLDLNTMWIHGGGVYPYVAGTAILGNRMEVFETNDGLKYLWLNRHSNLECYMQLLFF
jgi:hypothetical protein